MYPSSLVVPCRTDPGWCRRLAATSPTEPLSVGQAGLSLDPIQAHLVLSLADIGRAQIESGTHPGKVSIANLDVTRVVADCYPYLQIGATTGRGILVGYDCIPPHYLFFAHTLSYLSDTPARSTTLESARYVAYILFREEQL